MKILLTGGAGFIGTHVARRLLANGHEITILDNFLPQVHAGKQELPADIADHVRLVMGDVAERSTAERAIGHAQCIVHLAAETGTGQSMYEIERYARSNVNGTALLLDLLANGKAPSVERFVVASSRAIYGEGAAMCPQHGLVYPGARAKERMQNGLYETVCPHGDSETTPLPTPETAPFEASSHYGLTKQMQEQMVLLTGSSLGIPSIALRYQNVFGPGQSLSNPYTGILAIFSNLARLGRPIRVFEDGQESRDFVYIEDVVDATCRAVEAPLSGVHAVNIGSGQRTSVLKVAREILAFYASGSDLKITGEFRLGDIRHGSADLSRAQRLLQFMPRWSFTDGLRKFLEWAAEATPAKAGYDRSLQELRTRGLMHG